MNIALQKIDEPLLLFNHDQSLQDPRDGLTLFGPLELPVSSAIRLGIVGTANGIASAKKWLKRVQSPISSESDSSLRPFFPGFETAFHSRLEPVTEELVDQAILENCIYIGDSYQRVYQTVQLFQDLIEKNLNENETAVDIWLVVIPDIVYKYCRPESRVETAISLSTKNRMSAKTAKSFITSPSMFDDENIAAIPYQYEVNFHHQLKARLLHNKIPIQILRESTLIQSIPEAFSTKWKRQIDVPSAVAWNLSTGLFYKSGGKPWKLGGIRAGVCYVGLVYKKVDGSSASNACCAAQMFLDSGDGYVFRGAVGPWYNSERGQFHLSQKAARDLLTMVVENYQSSTGFLPNEIFIHGRTHFNEIEWNGFLEVCPTGTNLVGVNIQSGTNLKLFRNGEYPVLRGISMKENERTGFLWTKGYIPRLQGYPGFEVPNPIKIMLSKGEADIDLVMRDILSLTKLNYNKCGYGDGLPITIRFANAVGEVLTAGPNEAKVPPLPFKFYI
jgi:hypothetical protein